MIASVEGTISNDLKSKLEGTLKYANEYGFQRRIKELIRMLPEQIRDLALAGQKEKVMADEVRNNRDYYTHFGDVPKNLYSMHQLLFIQDRLKIMSLFVFLLELELPENRIVEVILDDYHLMERLDRAKGLFNIGK